MQLNVKQHIRHSFNRATTTYDEYSWVQQVVAKRLIELVRTQLQHSEVLVDLGCGTGLSTLHLTQAVQHKQFYAVDHAEKMLEHAAAHLNSRAIKFVAADFDNLIFNPSSVDLFFSNMALHWSVNLPATLELLKYQLAPQGYVAFSIPLIGTFSELSQLEINQFYSKNEVLSMLYSVGFKSKIMEVESINLEFESTITALRWIKKIGANYVFNRQENSLRVNKKLMHRNESHTELQQPLTYNIGYFIAEK